MARCLLLEAKLQKSMWPYAVMAAAYIRNRCFNARLGKTPYEGLTGSKHNLSKMHIFGCTCYAYTQNAKKLDPRSKKGIFVGYDKGSPAYFVCYPDTDKIEGVRCVKFFKEDNLQPIIDPDVHEGEHIPCETRVPIVSGGASSGKGGGSANSTEVGNDATYQPPRYPIRACTKPEYLIEYVTSKVADEVREYTVDYCYRMSDIPSSYSQAIHSAEADEWHKAMNDEIKALEENDTFELLPPPEDREIVGGKWVYTVKTGPKKAETSKARYVTKGYSQVPGIDYHETFSPTARMSSICVLLQHAVHNDIVCTSNGCQNCLPKCPN